MLTTFEKHPGKVAYFDLDYFYGGSGTSADDCQKMCISKRGCVTFDYQASQGTCIFSEITLQMVKDAGSDHIKNKFGIDLYIRKCA